MTRLQRPLVSSQLPATRHIPEKQHVRTHDQRHKGEQDTRKS